MPTPYRVTIKNEGAIIAGDDAFNGGSLPTYDIYGLALNLAGSAYGFTNRNMAYLAMGSGLTKVEILVYQSIINEFQGRVDTAMGTSRKVY